VTLLAAVVTSGLLSVIGAPYAHYLCWFSWSRFGALTGTVVYVLLGGVGGGGLGYLAGKTFLNANPSTQPWVDGVTYGVAGALVLRADFRTAHRSTSVRADQLELADAKSLLSAALQWTASAMDDWTRRKVEAWVASMSDGDLLDQARTANARIRHMSIPEKTKYAMQRHLTDVMAEVRSSDEDTSKEARKSVELFIAEFTVRHHQAKPHRHALV
jgi:hypothetical protein